MAGAMVLLVIFVAMVQVLAFMTAISHSLRNLKPTESPLFFLLDPTNFDAAGRRYRVICLICPPLILILIALAAALARWPG